MSAIFPEVVVGNAIRHQNLSVYPLFFSSPSPVEYVLAAEAITDGTLVVEEVSATGSVPNLSVTNRSNLRALFLEGEQLIGAKQNRILNTSLLVAANSTTTIPVSCVEQGRWRSRSSHFGSSPSYSPSHLRHALKCSVSASARSGDGHRSDQSRVWAEVACHSERHGVNSTTLAMEDTFDAYRGQLAEVQKKFGYVDGASGLAIAVGEQVVALDLFDKPITCHKVWDRLLSPALLDSVVAPPTTQSTGDADVAAFLHNLRTAAWEAATAAGEGEEVRAATDSGLQASALCFAGRIVHGSAVAAGEPPRRS